MKVGHCRRRVLAAPLIATLVLVLVTAALLGIPGQGGTPAAASPEGDETSTTLEWEASINGRPVGEIDANDPVLLDPEEGALLHVTLTNPSVEEVTVRSVRLDGKVMGLTMYNFTTRVDVVLPPDSVTTRTFEIDLIDLSGQATGLIPSRLQLIDADRAVLQEEEFPADIRGSVTSVYGVFGFAVLGITLLMLGSLLLRIRRTSMPENRWLRGMRFLPVGVGLGLVLTFTLSATRQLSPSATSWTTIVLLCGAASFAIGYFLPIGVAEAQESSDDMDGDADGPDGDTDDAALEMVGSDLAAGDATSATAGQASGHYWTSNSPEQADLDRPAGPEDDW